MQVAKIVRYIQIVFNKMFDTFCSSMVNVRQLNSTKGLISGMIHLQILEENINNCLNL